MSETNISVGSLVRVLPEHKEGTVTSINKGTFPGPTFSCLLSSQATTVSEVLFENLIHTWDDTRPNKVEEGQRAECLFEEDEEYYPGAIGEVSLITS